MAIKHIFVPLRGIGNEDGIVVQALMLAERLKAHVSASANVEEGLVYVDPAVVALSAEYYADLQKVFDVKRSEWHKRARADFDAAVAKTKVPIVNHATCHEASTYWVDEASRIAPLARMSDLVVMGRPGTDAGVMSLENAEDTLFNLRLPVLILPPNSRSPGRHAAVAWSGSAESINAVRQAVGLLEPGSMVTLIQVGDLKLGHSAVEDIQEYLGWHCFESRVRRIPDEPRSTAKLILSTAHAAGADMVVMGAYSHSRFRQLILGGVTSYMLRETDLPVFMAH